MLSGKLFAIAIAILAAAVNASPVEVAKRDANPIGGVYFCAGSDWVKPCNLLKVDDQACYNILGGISNNINSFRPNQGIACDLYADYRCAGNGTLVNYPGSSQLSNLNVAFEDSVSSFSCHNAN